jgi:uncharacterized protein with GYD domain
MQKWEYLLVEYVLLGNYLVNGMETPALKKMPTYMLLNELGEEGWELIQQDNKQVWLFKRPKT